MTTPEDHERMHRHLQKAANQRGQRSANCLACGQRFEPMGPAHDFSMTGHDGDTVFKLAPLTDEAKAWVEENVSREGYQPYWPTLVIEHRFIDALLDGIDGAGLTVDAVERVLAGDRGA